jgi:hypothetical protein
VIAAHVEEGLSELVESYRATFTRHCTCGAPECAKPTPADRHDYRVMASTLLNVVDLLGILVREGDLETASQLAEATRIYAEPALIGQLVAEPSWIQWREKFVAAASLDLEEEIREELAETSQDIGAELEAEAAAEAAAKRSS